MSMSRCPCKHFAFNMDSEKYQFAKESKRKNETADVLTEEQLQGFRDAFNMFDKDGSGSISVEELEYVMKSLGQNPSRKELEEAIASVDTDGSGEIDFDEFVEMMVKRMKEGDQETEIKEAFKVFDTEDTGELSVGELRHVMKTFGDEKLTDEEIEEMLSVADLRGTGVVNYTDFIRRITDFE